MEVLIADLIPASYNPRSITPEALEGLKASLAKFGQVQEIVRKSRNGIVVGGHQRLVAMRELGYETARVFDVELTDDEEKALNVALNSQAISGHFTQDLNELLDSVRTAMPIDYEALLLESLRLPDIEVVDEVSGDVDDAPEPPVEPKSKLGDLWTLGTHRLLCGDSTDILAVERLMDGKKADMVFTDPPYNTGMSSKENSGSTRLSHMFNDSYTDDEWQNFMSAFCSNYWAVMKDDSVAYICLDWRRSYELIPHIKKHFHLSNIIVWDKMVHGLGSDYKYTYELIHVCKKGKPVLVTNQNDDREYSDVWHIQRKMGKDEEHATKKPIELVERPIRHASKKGDVILDLFGGSGSTLMACETTKRKCFMMEMDPKYIDVILTRWAKHAGKDPVRDDGKKWSEL